MSGPGAVERAAAHWDARYPGPASADERAGTYALASPLYQRLHVDPWLSDDGVDWVEVVRRAVSPDGPVDDALVLGCGLGDGLLDFHRRGLARRLHGVDVSREAIGAARAGARAAGLERDVTFEVGDFHDAELGRERYDVVLFVMSLHHALDVEAVLANARRCLEPGGKLVANEYIGPDRWQFTLPQLSAIKLVLTLLPRRLRRRLDGSLKGRTGRPTLAWMMANDPSEAAHSSAIPRAIDTAFRPLLRRDYGGAIAIPVLDEIMHRFDERDRPSLRWLRAVLAVDRSLWISGVVPSANALFVAEKPATP